MESQVMGGFVSLASLGNVFTWIMPVLLVLGVVVIIHELGHFLVARYYGVDVEVFSIGFGPEIFGFRDRKGTRWRVSWIPLGGYVRFKGDENAASMPSAEELKALTAEERKGNFHALPVAPRAAVVAAGPLANFVLAFVIFVFWFMVMGKVIIEPRIETVTPGSPAEKAGLMPRDRILAIDGKLIQSFDDMQRIVMLSAGVELTLSVERDGQSLALKATPELRETKDAFGNTAKVALLGISRTTRSEDVTVERYGFLGAVEKSVAETYYIAKQPLVFFKELILGRASADQLGGPLRIAEYSHQVASMGWVELIRWTAIISISIGFLNLFPIPILDGGHLLFYGVEAIAGRPLNQRAQEIGFQIGFALILVLMIVATWNDAIHLLGRLG
jgi:regulator of sigma E protease